MAATLAVNDKKRHIFIPLGVRAKPYSQGVHLILLYYIRISLLSAETFFFYFGGGWWMVASGGNFRPLVFDFN